jgi:hypothetical protein
MKGIYLTPEGKQEIEAEIAELEMINNLPTSDNNNFYKDYFFARISVLKKILSSATILPVEESWEKLEENLLEGLHEHTKLEDVISIDYPNGVIIQPKQ